jgi:hypothetical protein
VVSRPRVPISPSVPMRVMFSPSFRGLLNACVTASFNDVFRKLKKTL